MNLAKGTSAFDIKMTRTKNNDKFKIISKVKSQLFANTLAGGLTTASVVGLFNPLDCLRIRWQVAGNKVQHGIFKFFIDITSKEGLVKGLWIPGLVANMSSIFISGGIRLGFYPVFRDSITNYLQAEKKTPSIMFASGLASGFLGYTLSSPLFQLKTRLQAQTQLDCMYGSHGENAFKNTKSGLKHIAGEGYNGIYRGASAVVLRGSLLSAGQQLGYDYTKTEIRSRGYLEDGPVLHVIGSFIASFSATFLSSPADTIMTRYQCAPQLGIKYNSVLHCVSSMYKYEGLLVFFRGWSAFWVRVCPGFIVSLPLYEQIRMKVFHLGYLD